MATWNELVAIEPRLNGVLVDALAMNVTAGDGFCMNDCWYGRGEFNPRRRRNRASPTAVALADMNPLDALLSPTGEPTRPGFKARVEALVGWDRIEADALRSENAYHVAYQTIYNALPSCRHDWEH